MKTREYYLDTVGGILLIYMIVGHCCQWSNTWHEFYKYTYWLGFFMPWFFYKGGMFHRQKSNRELIYASYKRLIIPFIWFSAIGTIILFTKYAVEGNLNWNTILSQGKVFLTQGSFPGNLPLWFLLSLFCTRFIFNLIHREIHNSHSLSSKICWISILVIIGTIFIPFHYISRLYSIEIPFYLFNVSSGIAFYSLGYLLKDFKPNNIYIILITVSYTILSLLSSINIDMRSGASNSILYPLWIPYSILGIISFNSIGRLFLNKSNLLATIGKDTMPYYCLHWCIILLISIFFTLTDKSNYVFLITLLIGNVIIIPICTRLIKKSKYIFIIG